MHNISKAASANYHHNIDREKILEWFTIYLDVPPLNSIVVYDNAAINNKKQEGTPTAWTKKGDIQSWIISKNTNFPPRALKASLLDIIKEELKNYPSYDINDFVKEHQSDVTIQHLSPNLLRWSWVLQRGRWGRDHLRTVKTS